MLNTATDPMSVISRHLKHVPVNIEAIVRDLGIGLRKNADLANQIAGQIKRIGDNEYEIASTTADHYFRQRFTIAHELGHFVLHRSLIGNGVDDDAKYRSTENGEFYNTAIDEYHERQANSFAASLLMPEAMVEDFLAKNANCTVKDMAREFQVSPSAMRWRLKNLGVYKEDLDK